MPYDAPTSLDELLADDERRRAAMLYAGLQPDPVSPPPAPTPVATAPAGAPAARPDFASIAQRYLEAQKQDQQDARFSRAASGLGAAARTINAGAGFNQPSMLSGEKGPSRAAAVEEAARIEAMGLKGGAASVATAKTGLSDEVARKNLRALYPDAPQDVIESVTGLNYEAVRKSLEGGAGRTERAGGLASREEMEKARLLQQKEEGKLNRAIQWARLRQDADEAGKSREFRRWLFEQEEDAKEEEARKKEAEAQAKEEKGQTLPAGEAASIGQSKAALSALDTLGKQFAAHGAASVGGKLATLLPWDTDPTKYEDDVRAAAQAVGTILEGGKLAAGDEVKYRKMFPAPGDSADRARNKLENVKRLVESLTGAKVEALDAAGYNVTKFKPQPAKPQRTTPDKVLPKDAAGNPTLDAPPPKAGKVRVREKSTGRMKDLAPDAAAKVLADPAYEKVTP